jgi:hypothetical protein
MHPWEIDPDQPRLSAGLLSRFRHYRNLVEDRGRLRQLLADFRFGPMRAVLREALRRSPALPVGGAAAVPVVRRAVGSRQ